MLVLFETAAGFALFKVLDEASKTRDKAVGIFNEKRAKAGEIGPEVGIDPNLSLADLQNQFGQLQHDLEHSERSHGTAVDITEQHQAAVLEFETATINIAADEEFQRVFLTAFEKKEGLKRCADGRDYQLPERPNQ